METNSYSAALGLAVAKMRQDQASEIAIQVFSKYWQAVTDGESGLVTEDEIRPVDNVTRLDSIDISPSQARLALAKTAVIKLNGGLGTSMGLTGPKSLIKVRDGLSFLDITVRQVLSARDNFQAQLPLILMNSFNTQQESLELLANYPDIGLAGLPLDFLQSREPKILADSFAPISHLADPKLEWCPCGHGDLYPSLMSSGVLDKLIAAGYRYAMVANGDNLGAFPSGKLAGWFAASGLSFAVEVCQRTRNDRKGGHLAIRNRDGRMIIREMAQTPQGDLPSFMDVDRHQFFNTNNIWLNLVDLKEKLLENSGFLGLPLIKNQKPVDPTDLKSAQIIQLETAMGAAVECFDKTGAILVERDRFIPVKTTDDLVLIRSNIYQMGSDYQLSCRVKNPPLVRLDQKYFRNIADFEDRFSHPADLAKTESLIINGDWKIGRQVTFLGKVRLETSVPNAVEDGAVVAGE